MARCKDPALTFLNQEGYNVVKLPRAGIGPMDVLGRDGRSLERLGKLERIWTSPVSVPQPEPLQPAAAINGKQTSNMKLSVGLKFLSDILGAMGAGLPQLDLAYRRAKAIQFSITNVHKVRVPPFQLGEFLSEGDLKTNNPFVAKYFDDDETDAYVIFEALTSDSITVTATNSSGSELAIDVPAIQELIGLNVKVGASDESNKVVTYKGDTALTFGFKAFEVEFDDGRWSVEGMPPSAGLAFDAQVQEKVSKLLVNANRVSLH